MLRSLSNTSVRRIFEKGKRQEIWEKWKPKEKILDWDLVPFYDPKSNEDQKQKKKVFTQDLVRFCPQTFC